MKALLLVLLALVALGCGSAEPVSASPDAASDAAEADATDATADAPTEPQDAAGDAMPDVLSCDAGMTACAASCVDVRTNPVHCGGCRRSCRSDETCVSGACVVPRDAGGDVVTIPRDAVVTTDASDAAPVCVSMTPGNCCGIGCVRGPGVAEATCVAGRCGVVCVAGMGDCDGNPANGCETDLTVSSANCGACGAACAGGGRCDHAICPLACAAGTADCDGNHANGCESTLNDALNCGACRNACSPGRSCERGACR
jgi:hypothetical protein